MGGALLQPQALDRDAHRRSLRPDGGAQAAGRRPAGFLPHATLASAFELGPLVRNWGEQGAERAGSLLLGENNVPGSRVAASNCPIWRHSQPTIGRGDDSSGMTDSLQALIGAYLSAPTRPDTPAGY